MKTSVLLLRSLLHYWRTNLAILVGVVVATAAISGALIVGDSVRDSLRRMSLDRLGRIDYALHSQRFFREDLAGQLAGLPEFSSQFDRVAPALVLDGAFEHHQSARDGGVTSQDDAKSTHRAGRIHIFGVDDRFWPLVDHGDVPVPTEQQVVLNSRTAKDLNVTEGDSVTLWLEIPASIPRDTLLGGVEEQTTRELSLTVAAILDETQGAARFALQPTQQLPRTAFLSLQTAQAALGLARVRPSRRHPISQPARVNALFVQARSQTDSMSEAANEAAGQLNASVADCVQLDDLGLRLRQNEEHAYFSLESRRMVIEQIFADAGRQAANELQMATSPVLVYLVNEFSRTDDPADYSSYSIIAGIDFQTCKTPPFGPFVASTSDASEQQPINVPSDGEIILTDWLARDLKAEVGSPIRLKYHAVGPFHELLDDEQILRVCDIVRLNGTIAEDRGWTPEVDGITDADRVQDWKQPFPMDLTRVTSRDEEFWDRYRAAPKAFVNLALAQRLWQTRYGRLTSLRIAARPGKTVADEATAFESVFRKQLPMRLAGFQFQPIKYAGLQAASGTTDFSGLFIGFSFFLVLAAILLIGLLFRLGLERRVASVGLFSAVGLPPRRIRQLFLVEGLILVCCGACLGTIVAVVYARVMVYGLTTWWIGAIGTRFLFVSIQPVSLITGLIIAVIVTELIIWWALRLLRGLSVPELLAGSCERSVLPDVSVRRARRAAKIGVVCVALAAILLISGLIGLVPGSEAFSGLSWQVVAFFLAGMLLLTACLTLLSSWLDSDRSAAVQGTGLAAIARLGLRNAARHRQRSTFSAALIASATFVIVAVAAGHRNPAVEHPDKASGNGGFLLVAESSVPILENLNTHQGREALAFQLDNADDEASMDHMLAMPFRMKSGENASCLNLYQTHLPTILGVTSEMIARGGFKFADTKAAEPWKLLEDCSERDGVPVIPVLGDMNTLMYSLHKGIGSSIAVPNEASPDYWLDIVGMLDGSVFQGVLLMSEENFQTLYPDQVGYRYFLIGSQRDETAGREGDAEQATRLASLLETQLTSYGFDAERVADRLAEFLAVQNTYLLTFQALGGFGLLLGTIGLATVMLRNVFERRSELALLRAVGFRRSHLALLVLWENAFLLLWGLLAGAFSAILAMLPHLQTTGADAPWGTVIATLAGVFVVGMVAALVAVLEAIRTPVVQALRSE